jgi:alkylhydroperoxidase/carboxymuconolactone decarboxylase family protein YurZ
MADPLVMKDKFYAWSNEVFSQPVFDPKSTNLLALVAALSLGSDGAVSYFYFTAKKAGATDAELAAAADIAAAVKGMNLYTLMPKE